MAELEPWGSSETKKKKKLKIGAPLLALKKHPGRSAVHASMFGFGVKALRRDLRDCVLSQGRRGPIWLSKAS